MAVRLDRRDHVPAPFDPVLGSAPRLLLLSALGDEVRLEAVRERLSQFSADGEEEEETEAVTEVLEDLIQKVVESQEVVRDYEDNKLEQSVSGPSHESGYLSGIDMAE